MNFTVCRTDWFHSHYCFKNNPRVLPWTFEVSDLSSSIGFFGHLESQNTMSRLCVSVLSVVKNVECKEKEKALNVRDF